ncbi:MAG TPA: GNAT family N-acetyltransferase, partial [Vicinamibacteria bacterium]|nr:GNAT family N-acetyltransferase [Vicinamibacteria bacterium]
MREEIGIRKATAGDLGIIMHHRRSMFADMGHRDPTTLNAMLATSEPLFSRGLENGSYQGWLAEASPGGIV